MAFEVSLNRFIWLEVSY